jgi:MoaA/NifB/PqqE/SkfB family radical SAM enzyme
MDNIQNIITEEARGAELKKAFEASPENRQASLEYGRYCKNKGQYRKAAEIFEKLLASEDVSREKVFLYRELAYVLEKSGEKENVIKALKKALEIDGNDAEALEMLGWMYGRLKEYDNAALYLKKAINIRNGFPETSDLNERMYRLHTQLAGIYYEKGESPNALLELETAVKYKGEVNDIFEKNKILNRIEYVQKKTILKSFPLRMMVCLTKKCNLNCIMCYNKYDKPWDLPESAINEFDKYFPYLEYMQWRGGEVFLYKNFRELFDKAASYPHLCQDIITNGTLIDEEWAERIVRTGTKLSLSIDGVHKDTYEKIRYGAKFEDIIRTLNSIKKYKKSITKTKFETELFMNFVVLRSNYNDIDDLIDFAHEYGIRSVHTTAGDMAHFPADDKFKNEDITNDLELIRCIQEKLPKLKEKARRLGVDFRNVFPKDACTPSADTGQAPACEPIKTFGGYCRAPWDSLFIYLYGGVRPHCFCDVFVGDVSKGKYSAMWNSPGMQQYREKIGRNDIDNFCSIRCRKELPWENIGLNL